MKRVTVARVYWTNKYIFLYNFINRFVDNQNIGIT